MSLASMEETDRLCGFTPTLFRHLEAMLGSGASVDEAIAYLRQSGVPMPAASMALKKAGFLELVEARNAVDSSAAYAKWPEYDEAYPEIHKLTNADAA